MRRQIRLELQRILKKKSGSEQSSVSQVCANSYLWNLYYFLFEEVILRIDLELRKMTDRWISFDSVSFCSHCLAQTFIFQLDFDNTTFSPYAPYFIVALLSWIMLIDYFLIKKLLTFPLCLKQIVHLPFPKGVFLNGFF